MGCLLIVRTPKQDQITGMAEAAAAAGTHVRYQVPLVTANLASLALESFLYGTFFVLAVLSIYLLFLRQRGQSKWVLFKKPMFVASVLLCITCTAHWILTVLRSFLAFVTFSSGEDVLLGGPLYFYADLHQRTEIVKTGFVVACICIGDAALIYRLWIISGRSIGIVIFPICTLLGLAICGSGITYQFSQFVIGEDVFASDAGRWVTSDCVFTLSTNFYCTVTIAWRVWHLNQEVAQHRYGGISYMPILATVVESAALYSVWAIFFFATYQSRSNLQFTTLDMGGQMSGIAFMLINARVGLGWAATGQSKSNGGGTRSTGRSASGGMVGGIDPHSPRGVYDTQEGAFVMTKDDEAGISHIGTAHSSYGPAYPLEVLNIARVVHSDGGQDYPPMSPSPPFSAFIDVSEPLRARETDSAFLVSRSTKHPYATRD